ncbi:putative hydrolase [Escherichia phage vB_Ec_Tarrare]|uniref:Hydrolase n=1 Tax=Escherichia phage vB_Ec_Tarrare TaxID=3032379 RepID=A0AAF0D4G4_9CAUD|nr:putative hydrolase [Escherichia phage vB_Ec_Tarrare]
MALHEVNLWNFNSRTHSSLDVGAPYGGLYSGRIDLPESYRKSKMFKVRVSGTHALETYASYSAMLTGIGGTSVSNLNGREAIIEFNTSSSTNGLRGIYSVEGVFVRDWHPDEALTKGAAEMFIKPHGVDEYVWTGSQSVGNGSELNLLSLNGFSTDVATGATTINAASLVVLPAEVKSRGLIISVILDGTYDQQGPHEMKVQIRSADGKTLQQSSPLYVLDKNVKKLTATFADYTLGVYDESSTTGFKLVFINDSTSNMSLTGVRIVVQNISNPDFTRS